MEARRFEIGDEKYICEVIRKDVLAENIYDYNEDAINHLIEDQNEETIIKRSEFFHCYTFLDNKKIVGVGMVGPYWDSLTESSFFTIFRDPEYKGKGLARFIIETLEKDEYYLRADRVEIPASITAVEFYKHFGWNFKKLGNIVDNEGLYRMEKFPKLNLKVDTTKYNMRPFIDNEHHNFKEFIYQTKKEIYIKENDGQWNEQRERNQIDQFIENISNDIWIIQLNGKNIGYYSGQQLENGRYEIKNICIIPEYQGKGIGTQVLKDVIELHKEQDIQIQCYKTNPIGKICENLGLVLDKKFDDYYLMIKEQKQNNFKL